MKIFKSLKEINNIEPTARALGNFDGMHLGHVQLIKNTVKYAKENGLKSAVFTFSNHPQNLLNREMKIKNILYPKEKNSILRSYGIKYMFDIPFTEDIHIMKPDMFVDELLIDHFKMKAGFCGFNYHFGVNASGNVKKLKEIGNDKKFSVDIMEPFKIDGVLVSSTLIRRLISEGKIEECDKYLGRNYSIEGIVKLGNQLGRTIGFPTSNIEIDNKMVQPSHGVYVTLCEYNKKYYRAVTNVGLRPTIGDEKKVVETYIFDFDSILYGKKIRVEFLTKLRNEMKFDDLEHLAKQIAEDKNRAEEYHNIVSRR